MAFVCEKCGQNYPFDVTQKSIDAALDKARKCCGLADGPCLTCQAKNFCQNKDPKNAMLDGSAARIKAANDLWSKRGCV